MYVQIRILDVQRQLHTFTLNGAGERRGDVEIQRVAKSVHSLSAAGLDSSGQIASVVTAETGFPQ